MRRAFGIVSGLAFALTLSGFAWGQESPASSPTPPKSQIGAGAGQGWWPGGASATTLPLSGGIDPTVRDYLLYIMNERDRGYDQRFQGQEKATTLAFQARESAQALALQSIKDQTASAFSAAEKAVSKQEVANDKRFDQLQTSLNDRFKAQDEKVAVLMTQMNLIAGRTEGSNWLWGIVVVGAGLLIGAIGLFVRVGPQGARGAGDVRFVAVDGRVLPAAAPPPGS